MRTVLANTSWDSTAVEMCVLIERARTKSQAAARTLLRPSPAFIASKRATEQTPIPQRKLRLRTA
jgi:hypothetical protein